MSMLLDELAAELHGLDLLDEPSALAEANRALEADPLDVPLPWYFRLFIGGAAWLSALFFLLWVVLGLALVGGFSDGYAILALSGMIGCSGLVLSFAIGWGPALYRRASAARRDLEGEDAPETSFVMRFGRTAVLDFAGQVGAVGTLVGQAGFAIGLALIMEGADVLWYVLIAQSLALLLHPSATVRALSVVGLATWIVALLPWPRVWPAQTVALVFSAAALAWWQARATIHQTPAAGAHGPIGYALVVVMLAMPGGVGNPWLVEQPYVLAVGLGLMGMPLVAWYAYERGAGVLALVGSVVCMGALAGLSWRMPGLVAALLTMLLATRHGDRVLLGCGVLGLVGYYIPFWIDLELPTGLTEVTAVTSGLVFLAAGWVLSRSLSSGDEAATAAT